MVLGKSQTKLHPSSRRRSEVATLKSVLIGEMRLGDLTAVLEIEAATFPAPWTFKNFRYEIERNPFAQNLVVRSEGNVVEAYANVWFVDGEVRVNNLAVRRESRGRGYGEGLLRHALDLGRRAGCGRATLEVRPSNQRALNLYKKMGFCVVGRRQGYYAETGEDSLVMALEL